MENSMIERVSRALDEQIHALANAHSQFVETHDGRYLGIEGMIDLREAAIAAIGAMREPTNGMENAAVDAADRVGQIDNEGDTNAIYRAMIDAALQD